MDVGEVSIEVIIGTITNKKLNMAAATNNFLHKKNRDWMTPLSLYITIARIVVQYLAQR